MRSRVLAMTPVLLTFAFSGGLTRPAAAQDLSFLTSLFKEISTVTLYGTFIEPRKTTELAPNRPTCLVGSICGGGAEVLLDLSDPDATYHLEFGLSATYDGNVRNRLTHDTANLASDSMELTALVRTFPSAALYLSRPGDHVSPYAGGSFGLIELTSARSFSKAGVQRAIKASGFGYGGHAGMGLEVPHLGSFFVEVGYRNRLFPALEYAGDGAVPLAWPRRLDFSGWELAAGWQFRIKPSAKDKGKVPDVWVLRSVDGDTVPAVTGLTAERLRTELRQMALHLRMPKDADDCDDAAGSASAKSGEKEPACTYELATYLRVVTLDTAGRTVSFAPKQEIETGTWIEKDDMITLTPKGAAKDSTRVVWRVGDQLVSIAVRPTHRLVFVRSGGK